MKPRISDVALYEKELNGEVPAGTLYNALYQESRFSGTHPNAAKSIASRRWNLANKTYWKKEKQS